jgi:curved DNA-binding protein
MNPYEILGVNKNSTSDEIKKAYRILASKNHPDKGGDTAKFQEIQTAYDILSDPQKRHQFDRTGSSTTQFNIGPENFEDLFAFFGFQNSPFTQHQRRKNQDIRTTINLNLEDILTDGQKNILIQTSHQQKTFDIKIPKGIPHGTTIKYPQLGDSLFSNLPAGDLYITVNINPHPRFQLVGLDLLTNLTIDCFQAILGCEQTIIGLDNKTFSLKIPAGVQNNTKLKISGEGLPAFRQDIKGNLLVQIFISIPTNLTIEQKNLITQIQKHGK